MVCISIRLVMNELQGRSFLSFNPKYLYNNLHPFPHIKSFTMASRSRHPPVSFSLKRHRVRARHPHPAASAKVTEHPPASLPSSAISWFIHVAFGELQFAALLLVPRPAFQPPLLPAASPFAEHYNIFVECFWLLHLYCLLLPSQPNII